MTAQIIALHDYTTDPPTPDRSQHLQWARDTLSNPIATRAELRAAAMILQGGESFDDWMMGDTMMDALAREGRNRAPISPRTQRKTLRSAILAAAICLLLVVCAHVAISAPGNIAGTERLFTRIKEGH